MYEGARDHYAGPGEAEIKKLDHASQGLRQQTANLMAQSNDDRWPWLAGLWGILLLVGFFFGMYCENNRITSIMVEL